MPLTSFRFRLVFVSYLLLSTASSLAVSSFQGTDSVFQETHEYFKLCTEPYPWPVKLANGFVCVAIPPKQNAK